MSWIGILLLFSLIFKIKFIKYFRLSWIIFPNFHKHEGFGGNVSIICVLLRWRLPYYWSWSTVENDDGGHDSGQHEPGDLMQLLGGGFGGYGGYKR